MSLDPMPDAATLMRIKAEREGRKHPSAAEYHAIKDTPGYAPVAARLANVRALASSVAQEAAIPDGGVSIALPWSALQTGNRFFGLTSKAYKAAQVKARAIVAATCRVSVPGEPPIFTVPVRLTVTLYMPNDHRRDLLNYAKLIADAMTGIVYRDDSQIHDAHFVRLIDVDAPRAVVTVTPNAPPPAATGVVVRRTTGEGR